MGTSSSQSKVGLRRTGLREGREELGASAGDLVCLSLCTGLPAPASAPILRADLAGIWGVSGVLLFGCVYLLHLLHRQRNW